MFGFLAILVGAVALLLAVQAMDVECTGPVKRRQPARSAAKSMEFVSDAALGGLR
jgi:hypothetical protein